MSEKREVYEIQSLLANFVAAGQAAQAEINAMATPLPAERLAELEAERHELLTAIDQLESERRSAAHRFDQLKEAAWSVLVVNYALSDDEASDKFELALRRLADIINYPGWYEL